MTAPRPHCHATSSLEAYVAEIERTLIVGAMFEEASHHWRQRANIRVARPDEDWPTPDA